MRLEKLMLKLFQVEPRVPVRILLDTSASMTTGDPSKFDYARRLAASLTYVGMVRLETMLIQRVIALSHAGSAPSGVCSTSQSLINSGIFASSSLNE